MAVKLKGETAAIKPSMPRYLIEFFVSLGFSEMGWYLRASFRKNAFNLRIFGYRKIIFYGFTST